jgi:4-amino-4-deoxy-L-arabinose transferase-like glycosyltransferase
VGASNAREVTRTWLPVALLTVVGAVLRFAALDRQSFWIDEIITVELVSKPLIDMLRALPGAESTPPLYYVLAWLWSQAAGVDEAGLRSLSALVGTLTIPVCYAAGRTLVSHRAGVIVAALSAVSPLLVWYSQEARAYGLFVLLGALSFLYFSRALADPSTRHLVLWATASSLTLLTHYFGAFLVGVEALVLLYRHRSRAAWLATGAIGAVAVAVLPLAAYQVVHASSRWIRFVDLAGRIEEAVRQLVVPSTQSIFAGAGVAEDAGRRLWPVGVAMVCGAVVILLALGSSKERRGGLTALGVGSATVATPVLISLAAAVVTDGRGDVFLYRNVIVAWLPLAIVLGAALGARRAGMLGIVAASILTASSLAVVVHIATTPRLQRDDWQLVSRALGAPDGQVVLLSPSWQIAALEHEVGDLRLLGAGASTAQVDLLVRKHVPSYSRAVTSLSLPPEFEEVETRELQNWVLTRFRARERIYLDAADPGIAPPDASYVPLVRAK